MWRGGVWGWLSDSRTSASCFCSFLLPLCVRSTCPRYDCFPICIFLETITFPRPLHTPLAGVVLCIWDEPTICRKDESWDHSHPNSWEALGSLRMDMGDNVCLGWAITNVCPAHSGLHHSLGRWSWVAQGSRRRQETGSEPVSGILPWLLLQVPAGVPDLTPSQGRL